MNLKIFLLVQEVGRVEEEEREKLIYLFHCHPSNIIKSKGRIFFSLQLNFVSSFGKTLLCILVCFLKRIFSKATSNSLKEKKKQIDNNFLASYSCISVYGGCDAPWKGGART